MKARSLFLGIITTLLLSITTSAEAVTYTHLDAELRQRAQQEYNVSSIEEINMRNKALFTEYYVTRADQYGPYPKKKVEPLNLRNVARDQRRYPAFGGYDLNCGNKSALRAYIAPTSQKNVIVRNQYYNEPITTRNKLPGITFYNNFSAYEGYTERW